MLRSLLLCLPILLVPGSLAERSRPNASVAGTQARSGITTQVGAAVRSRFELAAAAADCRFADNLYGYNLLLAQVAGAGKSALRSAAGEGRQRGMAAAGSGNATPCPALLNKLEAADDALVMLAEQVAAGAQPGR